MNRAAFALPMVLVLTLVAGLVVVVALTRYTSDVYSLRRQLDSYSEHHLSQGIQEALNVWVAANGTRPVEEFISEEDGHAFDLLVGGSVSVRFSLRDAQGEMLSRLDGLDAESSLLVAEVLDVLAANAGENAPRFVRREGPSMVSVKSAPIEVLYAIAEVTVGPGGDADALVTELLAAREEAGPDPVDLDRAFQRAGVPGEVVPKLQRLLARSTTLWRWTAEAPPPPGDALGRPVRFGGLLQTQSGRRSDRSSQMIRRSYVLTCERLGDEEQELPLPSGGLQP